MFSLFIFKFDELLKDYIPSPLLRKVLNILFLLFIVSVFTLNIVIPLIVFVFDISDYLNNHISFEFLTQKYSFFYNSIPLDEYYFQLKISKIIFIGASYSSYCCADTILNFLIPDDSIVHFYVDTYPDNIYYLVHRFMLTNFLVCFLSRYFLRYDLSYRNVRKQIRYFNRFKERWSTFRPWVPPIRVDGLILLWFYVHWTEHMYFLYFSLLIFLFDFFTLQYSYVYYMCVFFLLGRVLDAFVLVYLRFVMYEGRFDTSLHYHMYMLLYCSIITCHILHDVLICMDTISWLYHVFFFILNCLVNYILFYREIYLFLLNKWLRKLREINIILANRRRRRRRRRLKKKGVKKGIKL
jgi:hypothetical protein